VLTHNSRCRCAHTVHGRSSSNPAYARPSLFCKLPCRHVCCCTPHASCGTDCVQDSEFRRAGPNDDGLIAKMTTVAVTAPPLHPFTDRCLRHRPVADRLAHLQHAIHSGMHAAHVAVIALSRHMAAGRRVPGPTNGPPSPLAQNPGLREKDWINREAVPSIGPCRARPRQQLSVADRGGSAKGCSEGPVQQPTHYQGMVFIFCGRFANSVCRLPPPCRSSFLVEAAFSFSPTSALQASGRSIADHSFLLRRQVGRRPDFRSCRLGEPHGICNLRQALIEAIRSHFAQAILLDVIGEDRAGG
jgi:hypothetical protein